MKKYILSIFILAFTLSGLAQSQIGFKAGFLNPNYKVTSHPPNSNESFSVSNTMFYGLNYKRRWPGLFNFGAEVEYHQKKVHFTSDYKSIGADVHSDADYSLTYLNIRLLPEFVYGEKFRAYFQVGPYLGFLLSSNMEGTKIVSDGNGSVKLDESGRVSEYFPKIDWGIFVGGGVEYPIGKRFKLAVELQYSRGLAGFAMDDEYIFATKNFTAGLGLIYVFKGYAERIKDED